MKRIREFCLYFIILLSAIIAPQLCLANDYSMQVNKKIFTAWRTEGSGEEIYAVIKIEPSGKLSRLIVRAVGGGKSAAEKQIEDLIRKCEPFPPLPEEQQAQPWASLCFDSRAVKKGSLSGPYFARTVENLSQEAQDCIKSPDGLYAVEIGHRFQSKILPSTIKANADAKANIYLKLKSDGTIAKIFVVTEPVDLVSKKSVYDTAGRAQPYGKVPAFYSKAPYFVIHALWVKSYAGIIGVGCEHIDSPPSWLK